MSDIKYFFSVKSIDNNPFYGEKYNSCHSPNSGQFCSTGGGMYKPQSGSQVIGTAPYGANIYDKPPQGSDGMRKNYTIGQKVQFDYSSPTSQFRGSGKVVGFVKNDIVVEDKNNKYFVDGKNVFKVK